MRKNETRPRVTCTVPTVVLDKDKFSDYCRLVGLSVASLSAAYREGTYLSKRFRIYGGKVSTEFIDWCNRVFPAQKDKLNGCIIPDEPPKKPEEPKEEQIRMVLPSVVKDKVVTIQPVSLIGFNQMLDALNRIAERLEKLEEAWNGHRE